jgi:hypothetical protein
MRRRPSRGFPKRPSKRCSTAQPHGSTRSNSGARGRRRSSSEKR